MSRLGIAFFGVLWYTGAMKPIKIVKVYAEDHPKLNDLRRELTREVGEQGSYADVIRCLVELRMERNSPLLCKYRTLEELRTAE